jgi:hypothetical protein
MRVPPLVLAVLALLLGGVALDGGAASAKDEAKGDAKTTAASGPHLRYAKSCAEAMAEARERGCVIFATYHGDG